MKSGFISLIGRTNAGKSSLLNYLLGEDISMVSHKANATRRKVNGIVMHGENQLIFVDTPGLHQSEKLINKLMVDVAIKSIGDSDAVVFVASVFDDLSDYEKFLSMKIEQKHIVVITKTDQTSDEKVVKKLIEYQKYQDKFSAILPISIKKNVYKKGILDEISKILPEHPYFFDPELISSTNTKDLYRDFILEAVYESVSSEIPYATDVIVAKVKEEDENFSIQADIITDTNSHKQILIGKNAETIKRIGIRARKRISEFSKVKIYLKLQVVVKKSWKSDRKSLESHFIY